jgi:hypothetical protein
VLKNELAAGVYRSDKFGANAAGLRLQVLTRNPPELLKATALDGEYRGARPKRLRCAIFTHEASSEPHGRVARHARGRFVRPVTRALETPVRPGLRRPRARRRPTRTQPDKNESEPAQMGVTHFCGKSLLGRLCEECSLRGAHRNESHPAQIGSLTTARPGRTFKRCHAGSPIYDGGAQCVFSKRVTPRPRRKA